MLSTALIVFREILEAALIIGIVLTATRGVAGRTRWVLAGIGAGIFGAVLVAFSAEWLAQAAQGIGPELFNAAVLLVATGMLAWHNLWMAQHGRALATEMNQVGGAVASGNRPVSVLAMVVALAVLREGAELVLFVYGIATSGTDPAMLVSGGLLGVVSGAAVGALLYLGLLRIPTRHLFTVTSALLVLLAAGMAAQAASFLIQAGVLPAITPVLWDTSTILSERSIPGEMLHTLIGYADRPTGMQFLVYLLTVAIIGGLTLLSRRGGIDRVVGVAAISIIALLLLSVLTSNPAHAGHKVYYPAVEKGETEIELRGHSDFDKDPAIDHGLKYKFGVGHGFTDYWFSELYVVSVREPGSTTYVAEAYEWENLFRLTEAGKYWADLGLNVEYAHARKSVDANEWEIIPIVQKQFGRQLATINIPFSYETGNGGDFTWRLEYAWQYKWLGNPALEFGIEGYGKVGALTHWDPSAQREHQIGPSLFGKIRTGQHQALKYQLGLLFGMTEATAQKTLVGNLEFEF